jgi:ankyrin repeat protein
MNRLFLEGCKNDEVSIVEFFLNILTEKDINICNEDDKTALMIACEANNHKIVKYLLRSPKITEYHINYINKYKYNAFIYASIEGYTKSAKILIKSPRITEKHLQIKIEGFNVFTMACFIKDIDLILLLMNTSKITKEMIYYPDDNNNLGYSLFKQ